MTSGRADVSRETLREFALLVTKWTKRVNLISPQDVPMVWERHVENCLGLCDVLELSPGTRIVDVGSGGGFPGLIIGIVQSGLDLHLVESDTRKANFLREAARQLEIDVTIHSKRIEDLSLADIDVLTCRAFAPLPRLLNLVALHLSTNTKLVLMKGRNFQDEVKSARSFWSFNLDHQPNPRSPEGTILTMTSIVAKGLE